MNPFAFTFMPSASIRCLCRRESAAGIFGLSRASEVTTRCHGTVADSSPVKLLITNETCSAATFMCVAMQPQVVNLPGGISPTSRMTSARMRENAADLGLGMAVAAGVFFECPRALMSSRNFSPEPRLHFSRVRTNGEAACKVGEVFNLAR